MKYSAVIFDWDGTLGMTLDLWLAAYRDRLESRGDNLSDEVIVKDFFYEHAKLIVEYPDIDYPIFMKEVHDYIILHIPSLALYQGAEEALEKLKESNITLTLVSSSSRRLLKEELALHDLNKFFSAIVGSDDVMKHKPDPEPFLTIVEIAKLDPKTTLILGDSLTDIWAAQAAGIDSCAFYQKRMRYLEITKRLHNQIRHTQLLL